MSDFVPVLPMVLELPSTKTKLVYLNNLVAQTLWEKNLNFSIYDFYLSTLD